MELNSDGRNITYDLMTHHAKRSFYYKKGGDWVRVNLVIRMSSTGGHVSVCLEDGYCVGIIRAYPLPSESTVCAIDRWGKRLLGTITTHLHIRSCDIKEITNLYDLL